MPVPRRSLRLQGIKAPEIHLDPRMMSHSSVDASVIGEPQPISVDATVIGEPQPQPQPRRILHRRRWRAGVLREVPDIVMVDSNSDAIEDASDASEDSLFLELTQKEGCCWYIDVEGETFWMDDDDVGDDDTFGRW